MKTVIVNTNTKRENVLGIAPHEAKTAMLGKISSVIGLRRKEVENALILTGSPKDARNLNYKGFNAAVMNRLSETGERGDRFRSDMAKLVTVLHGKKLSADGFFRKSPPRKGGLGGQPRMMGMPEALPSSAQVGKQGKGVSSISDLLSEHSPYGKDKVGFFGWDNSDIDDETDAIEITEDETILDIEETEDGGVVETKSKGENVGAILSGSAQVLDSIGGILGLFSGGNQQQTGNNNDLNGGGDDYVPDTSKSKSWVWIVVGLVVIGAVVGLLIYMKKKKK